MKTVENTPKDLRSEQPSDLKLSREELKKKIQRQREIDSQMVKGIFRFHEMPNGTLSFTYRAYKGDENSRYNLTDGQVHTIPIGVAKHLNKNGWYPEYEYIKGEKFIGGYGNEQVGMRISRKVHRYAFSGLDFIDTNELEQDKQIFTVSKV